MAKVTMRKLVRRRICLHTPMLIHRLMEVQKWTGEKNACPCSSAALAGAAGANQGGANLPTPEGWNTVQVAGDFWQ